MGGVPDGRKPKQASNPQLRVRGLGRELRQVSVNGVDVAETMNSAGLARSYDGGKKQRWC